MTKKLALVFLSSLLIILIIIIITLILFSKETPLHPQPPEPESEEESQIVPQCPVNETNVPFLLIKEAQIDLASRLNISQDQIKFFCAERTDWPDTSLGLPQPDKVYAQVITPGFRLLLKVNEKTYQYHTDYQRVLFAGER